MATPTKFSDFPLGLVNLSIGDGNIVGIIDTELTIIDDELRKLIPDKHDRYVTFTIPQKDCQKEGATFTLDAKDAAVASSKKYDDAKQEYKDLALEHTKKQVSDNASIGKTE